MNTRPKSKSKISIVKPYSTKSKKIRKKSPKIIDYNKVAQKYGNLLETSLNTSNSTQPQKALNSNNNIDDSYYDYIIDNIYETAIKAGATGGKISGAGGGGFFMFYCPDNTRYKIIPELQKLGGEFRRFRFTNLGAESWTVK